MPDLPGPPPARLDSWKAIATYLGRDERTVRRWEKTFGLPVRRVPGMRGSSVFAYVSEIEAWLQSTQTEREPAAVAPETSSESRPSGIPGAPAVAPPGRRWWYGVVGALMLGSLAWRFSPSAAGPLSFQVTSSGIVASDRSGAERWRHPFEQRDRVSLAEETPWVASRDGRDGMYVLVSRTRIADDFKRGGQLLGFDHDGKPIGAVALEDQVTFGAGRYGPPWQLPSFRLDDRDGGRLIALAAHHDIWWPGLVTVLDGQLHRRSTFVNAGWIETIRWVSPRRLLVAGFANPQDGGMVTLLDVDRMNGQSPEPAGSPYYCQTCGPDRPLRYVVFPKSELNQVTAHGFNRARLDLDGDRVLVRTDETAEPDGAIVDALYQLTPSLDLVRATYSDRYWELHLALEGRGTIHHSRNQCPDRDGPRAVLIWDAVAGWRTIKPAQDLKGDHFQ